MIKAVILDMDGVVIDSIRCDFLAWKRIFSRFEIELSFGEYKKFSGMKAWEILRQYVKNISEHEANILEGKREKYFSECLKRGGVMIMSGTQSFLNLLVQNGIHISLATAATRNKVADILKHFNIESYFRVIVTGDDVSRGKPDPETFLKVAEILNVRPEECVVIEDAPNGIMAAKNSNMKCIAITTTHAYKELTEADKIIDSFTELTLSTLRQL